MHKSTYRTWPKQKHLLLYYNKKEATLDET